MVYQTQVTKTHKISCHKKKNNPHSVLGFPMNSKLSLTNKKINVLDKKTGRACDKNQPSSSKLGNFLVVTSLLPFFFILLQGVCQPGFIHFLGFFINLPGLLVRCLFQASFRLIISFGPSGKKQKAGPKPLKTNGLETGFW